MTVDLFLENARQEFAYWMKSCFAHSYLFVGSMETWLRLWRNACLQFWNNSTSCHWQLEVQHYFFIILFFSWYSCRGDKWGHISASFMWEKLMIRLHVLISLGHLYASQAVRVYMWGHSGVSRRHCCSRSRSSASNTNLKYQVLQLCPRSTSSHSRALRFEYHHGLTYLTILY